MRKKIIAFLLLTIIYISLSGTNEVNPDDFTQSEIFYLNKINFLSLTPNKRLSLSETKLKQQLNLKQDPFYKKFLFWQKKPVFEINLAIQDEQNLKRFFQANGYLYVEITTTLSYHKKNQVTINYYILENQPVMITNSTIILEDSQNIEIPEIISKKRNISKHEKIKSRPNTIFIDNNVFYDQSLINSSLINTGFLKAETDFDLRIVDSLSVNLSFIVNSGNQYYTKGLVIRGNKHTSKKTLLRILDISDSVTYTADLINKNQSALIRTGVFRSVQIYPQFTTNEDYAIPTISLVEKAKWTLQTGIGWGSEEKIRTLMQLSHHNLLNIADQQDISFRSSALEPINIQLLWTQPALFHRNLKLSLNPFFKREKEEMFSLDIYGNISSFSYNLPAPEWSAGFSHLLEQNKLQDIKVVNPEESKSIYNQSTFYTQLDINYSTPQNYPIKGIHLISGGGIAGVGFNSPYDYILLQQEIRYYQPGLWLFNYAFRVAANTMQEIKDSPAIPIEKRLYLGGMQSVRGFNRNELSPYNENNQAIGGRSSLLMNLETRFPIFTNFNGAILIDSGQVWEKSNFYKVDDLSYSLGLGLRYITPIGTIRADFAKPFINDSGSLKFYLTIGEAF